MRVFCFMVSVLLCVFGIVVDLYDCFVWKYCDDGVGFFGFREKWFWLCEDVVGS